MNTSATPQVGKRIRSFREQQGYSLRTLAERSGLSINAISLIERGENSPTVSSLQQLATALEVPIIDLFREEENQPVVFVNPPDRLRSTANGITLESLGIGLRNQQLEPFLFQVGAGQGSLIRPVSHSGEEFVYCLEGAIIYWIGERIYDLQPGTSLLFDATIPHCFYNGTEEPALLLIVFLAGEGGHQGRHLHMAHPAMEDNHENVNQLNS